MLTQRPPYGRVRPAELVPVPDHLSIPESNYRGETYYDREAIKPPHYGKLIAGYFFVGGIAAGAEILATTADLFGSCHEQALVRSGRYVALVGAAVSPVLLTVDLHTPRRFFNMLRILRPTSAMSIGAWILTAFGTLSGIAAAGQALEDLTGLRVFRRLARTAGVPAAASGLGVATYTGTLLVATSNPLWISGGRLLPAAFGASALSTAAAAMQLIEHAQGSTEGSRSLERIGVAAAATELALSAILHRKWHAENVAQPLEEEPLRSTYRLGFLATGLAAPLIAHGLNTLLGNRSRGLSVFAATATLVGGLLFRHVLVKAGRKSAARPKDYFHYTQPVETFQATPAPKDSPPLPAQAVDAAQQAMIALEDVTGKPARKVRDEIDDAEACAVRARDVLIAQLRQGGSSTFLAKCREALNHVNLALSEIVAVDYPTHGIQQKAIKTAREELEKATQVMRR